MALWAAAPSGFMKQDDGSAEEQGDVAAPDALGGETESDDGALDGGSVDREDAASMPGDTGASEPKAALGPETFLTELERRALPSASDATLSAGEGTMASRGEVSWEEAADVDEAASRVISSYQAYEGSWLVTSGFLDLKGNAWGAVVWDASTWVDVVTVSAIEDGTGAAGGASRVRVVRFAV